MVAIWSLSHAFKSLPEPPEVRLSCCGWTVPTAYVLPIWVYLGGLIYLDTKAGLSSHRPFSSIVCSPKDGA